MSHCGICRPHWRKLVDNIYPNTYDNRLPNMPKLNSLTYYSCRKPEKLKRISDYVCDRMSHHMCRNRIGYVFVSMEIIDNLIKICQDWVSFIDIYLSMLTSVLESSVPELQILGTHSFEKFSQIDKETPNYLKSYEQILKCFVAMSHNNNSSDEVKQNVRCAGLQGIRSLIRRVASDDLQMNIWEKDVMCMIVSASLFNLEDGIKSKTDDNAISVDDVTLETDHLSNSKPFDTAKETLQELVMRANYNNIECIVEPVLVYFDNNQLLWVPNDFGILVFEAIISRIPKTHQAHTIVDCVIKKLNSSYSTDIKRSIVQVVISIVGYAANDAIGPAVYHVYKELCQQLLSSIDRVFDGDPAEINSEIEAEYREEIIRAMVKFAEASHDTQKVEIMKYILSFEAQYNRIRTTTAGSYSADDERRKKILMKALLKTITTVAENYKTTYLCDAFPFDFLPPLVKIAMNPDPGIRVYVQNILQFLIDRHENKEILSKVKIYPLGSLGSSGVTLVKPSHSDLLFMKSAMGAELINHLYAQVQEDTNRVDNYEKLYSTLSLLTVETAGDDAIVDLFRLGLQIQKFVVGPECTLKIVHKSAAHALIAAFFNLLCQLQPNEVIKQHVMQVIAEREANTPHFLPKVAFNRSNTAKSYPPDLNVTADILFSDQLITDQLAASDFDVSNIAMPFESLLDIKAKQGDNLSNRGEPPRISRKMSTFHYFREYMQSSGPRRERRESAWSLALTESEYSGEVEHCSKIDEKEDEEDEDITFAALKRIMYESSDERAKRRDAENKQIEELYNTLSFEELVQRHRSEKVVTLHETFEYIHKLEQSPRFRQAYVQQQNAPTINEIEFPSLFVF